MPSSLGIKYRLIISNEKLTFSRRFQKSRKDAKSGRVILKQSLRLSGKSSSSGSYVLPPPLSQRITSRQGALRLHYVDLYPLWTSGQMEKCEFWQLLLWALTSRDSFSPKLHPRSDFPTSAIIYWQELFLFLRLKELTSAILNKTPRGSKRWTESSFSYTTSPAQGSVFPSIVSHFWRCWQHKSSPDTSHCPSVSPKQRQVTVCPALTQLGSWDLRALFHGASSKLSFRDKHFQYYMMLT